MKKAADRFSAMKDVRIALEHVADDLKSSSTTVSPQSIAVLPFANISGDRENEYFSDGLAEEILNALTHVPGLKVIARTSAFAFKAKNEDIRRIADTLGVAHVLEGSVRKAGQRIRVTAQLITAVDGTHLWSERYDRDLEDVFAIQDDIARAIATALRGTLLVPHVGVRHTPTIAAYDAFLKGRHTSFSLLTPESIAMGQQLYRHAIELDPQFAEPHVYLAASFFTVGFLGLQPMREIVGVARSHVRAALALEPDLPDAHAAMASFAALHDFDWKEAEREYRLATARDSI
jgi:TolB-like protein